MAGRGARGTGHTSASSTAAFAWASLGPGHMRIATCFPCSTTFRWSWSVSAILTPSWRSEPPQNTALVPIRAPPGCTVRRRWTRSFSESRREVTNWLANGCHPLSLLVRPAGRAKWVRTIRGAVGEGAVTIEFARGVFATFPLTATGVLLSRQPEFGSLEFARQVMELYEAALISQGDMVAIDG